MENTNHKPIGLDDLATMVADGFNDLGERIDKVEGRLEKVEYTMVALKSSVNNYLELSDKRYLELKRRDAILANWLKAIADKTGVSIDLSQLEKFN